MGRLRRRDSVSILYEANALCDGKGKKAQKQQELVSILYEANALCDLGYSPWDAPGAMFQSSTRLTRFATDASALIEYLDALFQSSTRLTRFATFSQSWALILLIAVSILYEANALCDPIAGPVGVVT